MIKFKLLPDQEKPRERFLENGPNTLTNEDLLAIIIKTGTKNLSVKEVALILLSELKNITDLKDKTYYDFIKIPGIGKVKAIELAATIELGKRINQKTVINSTTKLNHPCDIYQCYRYLFIDKKQEEFYVIYLDTQKRVLAKKLLFKGTVNCSVVHPREIFKMAYQLSTSYIICLHNHPTGEVLPSKEDINVTRQIYDISIIHGIGLMDHIIIGNDKYYSFYENNCVLNSKINHKNIKNVNTI